MAFNFTPHQLLYSFLSRKSITYKLKSHLGIYLYFLKFRAILALSNYFVNHTVWSYRMLTETRGQSQNQTSVFVSQWRCLQVCVVGTQGHWNYFLGGGGCKCGGSLNPRGSQLPACGQLKEIYASLFFQLFNCSNFF